MKLRRLLAALLLLTLFTIPALAEDTAPELTKSAAFTYGPRATGHGTLTDGSYLTYFTGAYLEVSTSAPCHHLYFSYALDEVGIAIQVQDESGAWVDCLTDSRRYTNLYLPLPGLTRFRIVPLGSDTLGLSEIHLFGEGQLPAWVQTWQPFEGKADLLVLSAHCDDELLFFGGVIPYYTAERQMNVIVCYLTHQTHTRRSEALDGLWTCGVRSYPEMGVFTDVKVKHAEDCYPYWGGEETVRRRIAELINRYQPEVMVTHDTRGEYGHGAHKACAAMAMEYVDSPADGSWPVKKLYLHLYKQNPIVMDWRQPLAAFGGKTAFDVAQAAFDCHDSQKSNGLIVQDWGNWANNRFGLYHTSVGPDTGAGDMFENVP